jgi:hypothetical protein
MTKNAICLWYEQGRRAAAGFAPKDQWILAMLLQHRGDALSI